MNDSQLSFVVRKMLLHFDLGVLASYQHEAHKYEVITDDFEGKISIRNEYYRSLSEDEQKSQVISFSFGFRTKRDGSLAIVVWAPDMCEHTPEVHQQRWLGFRVPHSDFPEEFDQRFLRWARRYLDGDWGIEDGPISRLEEVVAEINAITEEGVARPLFKAEQSVKLVFPNAENDSAYRDAHSAVYGFIIDGLDKETIADIAAKLGIAGKFDSDKTLAALKKVICDTAIHEPIFAPFQVVSTARGKADHGVPPTPSAFPAFERFSTELEAVVAGMLVLRDHLATELQLDVERCVKRRQMKQCLPRFDTSRQASPHFSVVQARNIVGKTIEKVEYGFHEPHAGVHESELIILHCTDGSILAISTGSNASNLSRDHAGMEPEDFHSSFALTFVPSAK